LLINKLQNGAIPTNFQKSKIRNIRFIGNAIVNGHRNFNFDVVIIVASLVL